MKKIINKILRNQRGAMDKLILSLSFVIIGTCTGLITYVIQDEPQAIKVETVAEIEAYMNKYVPAAGDEQIETVVSNRQNLKL